MFTHPAPAPSSPGLHLPALDSAAATASPVSPAPRASRLRGLSYLRNSATHLLSRDHAHQTTTTASQPSHSPQPVPSSDSSSPSPAPSSTRQPSVDSASFPPVSPDPVNPPSASRSNRFSLVPALTHPLGSLPAPFGTRTLETAPATTATSPTTALGRRSTESSVVPPVITTTSPQGATISTPADSATSAMTRTRSATTGGSRDGGSVGSVDVLPSIRFSTFYDPRATRPSLTFSPISRTLPTGTEIIRVGRYSDRDTQPNIPHNAPSAAPVGFKSKVVSRRHCEFWYEDGKWFIKDVKSSSGTFLNHIRLSPPGTESKPFTVNDGDIVQLGIDFKGGEEMIFRCVKMRLELNRNWQSKLNTFNMNTHKRLRNMTASSANDPSSQSYSQDCSICLNRIAPCQCLFVAPCSHTWHYKCIRSLLASPSYPIFICPNCRAAADLEAEVEDPEEWEQLDSDEGDRPQEGALLNARDSADNQASLPQPRKSRESVRSTRQAQVPPQPRDVAAGGDATVKLDSPAHFTPQTEGASLAETNHSRPSPYSTSSPMPIPPSGPTQRAVSAGAMIPAADGRGDARTPSPTGAPVNLNTNEGPITPRNDAGPWVFDGSGVRLRVDGTPAAPEAGGGAGTGRPNNLEADDDVVMT
ncbi:hypothetical protein QBC47DRAFT_405653 [Echria macrotheca]|uniref:RING-type E3 ubiquitin transferase n=1 Tax=Echria macrotheca TaxID=438768 RepID=A0AAJ0F2Y0_9PEZI|nr:hypothetical protein QBC47DRAFT_405653 [Echria macrotheca]